MPPDFNLDPDENLSLGFKLLTNNDSLIRERKLVARSFVHSISDYYRVPKISLPIYEDDKPTGYSPPEIKFISLMPRPQKRQVHKRLPMKLSTLQNMCLKKLSKTFGVFHARRKLVNFTRERLCEFLDVYFIECSFAYNPNLKIMGQLAGAPIFPAGEEKELKTTNFRLEVHIKTYANRTKDPYFAQPISLRTIGTEMQMYHHDIKVATGHRISCACRFCGAWISDMMKAMVNTLFLAALRHPCPRPENFRFNKGGYIKSLVECPRECNCHLAKAASEYLSMIPETPAPKTWKDAGFPHLERDPGHPPMGWTTWHDARRGQSQLTYFILVQPGKTLPSDILPNTMRRHCR